MGKPQNLPGRMYAQGLEEGEAKAAATIAALEQRVRELDAEVARLRAALAVPAVWPDEERDGMSAVFDEASQHHGHYETLFAVAAWLLRRRLAQANRP